MQMSTNLTSSTTSTASPSDSPLSFQAYPSSPSSPATSHVLFKDIADDYVIKDCIGKGGYGQVYEVTMISQDEGKDDCHLVAKHISHNQKNEHNEENSVEIQELPNLFNQNILCISAVYHHQSGWWLVSEKMNMDLKQYLENNRGCPSPNEPKVRKWMQQLLRAVAYCHDHSIIHADIKPSNIFLDKSMNIVLGDFGSAKRCRLGAACEVTQKAITTLAYSPPEIVSVLPSFDHAVDIWSCACVFAQLLLGNPRPIFNDTSEFSQLDFYFHEFGAPCVDEKSPAYWLEFKTSSYYDYIIRHNIPNRPLPGIKDGLARDLLLEMFQINPSRRVTARNALTHPYFMNQS